MTGKRDDYGHFNFAWILKGRCDSFHYLSFISSSLKASVGVEAVNWYRLSAEQGNATAQNNLGVMYNDGLGVPQDHGTAHMWYNIASANGDEDASENRDTVANKMTGVAIAEAQRRARNCLSSDYQDCGG